MIVASFLVFLAFFLGIGLWASSKHQKNAQDYLLAGRSISPWLVGLSVVATENSGFMFIGYVGFAYYQGISAIWLFIGFYLGMVSLWPWLPRNIRMISEREDIHTFPELLGKSDNAQHHIVLIMVSLITLVLLCVQAAAQLTAGGKALQALFAWPPWSGAAIGALILLAYGFSGGIRASIWVHAIQLVVMMLSLLLLFVGILAAVGGIDALWQRLQALGPGYLDLAPSDGLWMSVLFITGWAFGGVASAGQPHIVVRYMTMRDPDDAGRVRNVYFAATITIAVLATLVALSVRVLVPEISDPELTLPTIAQTVMHEAAAGLMLAGLFAATMSTADSQVMSAAAALSQNLLPSSARSYTTTRYATLVVISIALVMALVNNESVFQLVLSAWAMMGSALGPAAIIRALGAKPNEPTQLAMIVVGLTAMLLWRHLGYHTAIYEALPGIFAGFVVFGALRFVGVSEAGTRT